MTGILAATWGVRLVGVYVLIGVIFAVVFVIRGVGAIDPAAKEGTWGFRILVFPGVVALWPLLAKRWISGTHGPPEERNAHRAAAREARSKPGASS